MSQDFDHLLIGEKIRIVPYKRGLWPPATLAHLWALMAEEHALARVFYAQECQSPSERGDLHAFMSYFSTAVLFLVHDPVQIAGAVWFTDVTAYKGNIGIYHSRRIQGPLAREATDRVCRFAFAAYLWEAIWGFTPWKAAARHGELIGFERVATLERFVRIGARMAPMHIVRRLAPCQQQPGNLDLRTISRPQAAAKSAPSALPRTTRAKP